MTEHPARVPVESLCLKVTTGGTPSRSEPRYWENGTIPWFKTGELKDWYVNEPEERITEYGLLNSAAKVFPPDTVLMALYGDGRTITSLGLLRGEATTNQACCAMIADPARCHFLYLFYALKHHRRELLKLVVAGAQRNLSNGIVRGFKILYRPLPAQVSIVSILSAYDDLIENNTRRIRLLEDAIRLLYEEWFVRLRFPGYEHVKVKAGVPEGWERLPLSALSESIDYGYTASAEWEPVGPKFLRITDIVGAAIDWPSVPHCVIPEDKHARMRLQEGDIVIARTGATVGYAKRIPPLHPDVVFASYLVRVRIGPQSDNVLIGTFVESAHYKAYVRSCVGGAAQPNANARVLAAAPFLNPPAALRRAFREVVEPLLHEQALLQKQSNLLKAARDLLLPRLMSGEVAV